MLPEITDLCHRYPQTMVDISGDYFNAKMPDRLGNAIGCDRILYGSDCYWIDPRCILGMLFVSSLSDMELQLIVHDNAVRFYAI